MKFQNKKAIKKAGLIITAFLIIAGIGILMVFVNKEVTEKSWGKMINPAVQPTKDDSLKKLLIDRGIEVNYIDWKDNLITVYIPGNLIVLFLDNANLESKVTSLQFIISRSKIEGRRPVKIDLRFDKPIINY